MFTGIVQATAIIVRIEEKEGLRTHYVRLPKFLLQGLEVGASVSHNGCCLTVTSIIQDIASFDIIQETLKITTLGSLKVGNKVNLERAASLQKEIGGHFMSGHISCTAQLSKVVNSINNRKIWFTLEKTEYSKYIGYKGFIGIDGISLTIGETLDNLFCVYLIPETIQRTTLGIKQVGDRVNIEIDSQTKVIVDTVERVLRSNVSRLGC